MAEQWTIQVPMATWVVMCFIPGV